MNEGLSIHAEDDAFGETGVGFESNVNRTLQRDSRIREHSRPDFFEDWEENRYSNERPLEGRWDCPSRKSSVSDRIGFQSSSRGSKSSAKSNDNKSRGSKSGTSGSHSSRSKSGIKLSREMSFGDALERSNRRRQSHDLKVAQKSGSQGTNGHEAVGKNDNSNCHGASQKADVAIIEYNDKLKSELAAMTECFEKEKAKNTASEQQICELRAIEKFLKEENSDLKTKLARTEATNIALNRRFEMSKNVKAQTPWKNATKMVLKNFRAISKITESALVNMGATIERKEEFEVVASDKNAEGIEFGVDCELRLADIDKYIDNVSQINEAKKSSK